METTDWDRYGTGNYEKCADCMAHCGYEATAVSDAVKHPLKALRVALGRFRTEGPMAPEIALDHQRPAEQVFEQLVKQATRAATQTLRQSRGRARAQPRGVGWPGPARCCDPGRSAA